MNSNDSMEYNDIQENKKNNSSKNSVTKSRKELAEKITNANLKINKDNESLPPISLFNQNEKKILMAVLPEKEIKKYEKRYEIIDSTKNNLERKYALESRLLNKENQDLENRYEFSSMQLKENEQKNKLLSIKINEQKIEVKALTEKLENLMKTLEIQKNKVKEKDVENKKLVQHLQQLQNKYKKAEPKEEDNEDNEEKEEDNEEENHNYQEEDADY